MQHELHIHLYPEVYGPPDEILAGFPYSDGQNVLTYSHGLIVIDLAAADDTSLEQEWYLNDSGDVQSFYIVDDDPQ